MLLPILAAVFANNLIGALWYTPSTFLYCVMDRKEAGKCPQMGLKHIAACQITVLFSFFCHDRFEITRRFLKCMVFSWCLIFSKWALFSRLSRWLTLPGNSSCSPPFPVHPNLLFVNLTVSVHYVFNNRAAKEMLAVVGHHLFGFVVEGAIIYLLQ